MLETLGNAHAGPSQYHPALDVSPRRDGQSRPRRKRPAVNDGNSAEHRVRTSDQVDWEHELRIGAPTTTLTPFGALNPSNRSKLDTFRTPGCCLELRTKRLRLRQVEVGDTRAIERIKTEPMVQKTQLYGSPTAEECKTAFQTRYIFSSMPRLSADGDKCRDEFVFAITLKDPRSVELGPAHGTRIANRLGSAEGYIGNIGLALSLEKSSEVSLLPRKGVVFTHPTLEQTAKMGLRGDMFYEIHPQLWNKGIMSEAFDEVLRFAIETVGCVKVVCNPTTTNAASVKLCTKRGFRHTHTNSDNWYNKPQAFYEISRDTWLKRNRPAVSMPDTSAMLVTAKSPAESLEADGLLDGSERSTGPGSPACRWCMSYHRPAAIKCGHCDWAFYCSKECQRADWVFKSGHQAECDGRRSKLSLW